MYRSITFVKTIFLLVIIITALSCNKTSAPTDAPVIETMISGVVTDKVSGAVLQGAQITTIPVTSTLTSDANGKYEFSKISAGSYVVAATKAGYKDSQINVTVTEGNTAKADIQLEQKTAELEVTPTFIDFSTGNSQAILTINNKSAIGTLNFTLSKTASWLTLSESAGSITNNLKYITVSVDRSVVNYGSYNDVITVTSDVGNTTISVQMIKQNPSAPQLTVTPILSDFGTSQTETNVTLSNTGTGTLSWSAVSSDGWITVTPNSGDITTNSTSAKLKVNRSGLAPGNFNGTVIFSSNGGNQTATVKMNIPAVPILSVSPGVIDFGETSTTQNLQINNIGTGSLTWSIVSNQPWLTTSPAQGTNYTAVSINANRTGMSTGTYTGVLTISSNGGSTQVSVTMAVPPPAPPPSVILGAPENVTYYSVDLRWQQSTLGTSDFASYKIYKDVQPNVTESSALVATITANATTTKTVAGLTGSTQYYFRIYVVNAKGGSAGSNIVSATTQRKLGSWLAAQTLTGVNPTANCLYAVSETNVWVVGDEIWHYNGATWTKDLKPSGIGKLNAVFFSSATEGWAVGANGTVIRYNGSTWTVVTSSVFPTSSNYFSDVVLTSGNDVWIAGYGSGAFYHFDGNIWTKNTISSNYIYDLELLNSNEIYASTGSLWKYNGVGWSLVSGSSGTADQGISAISSNNVWSVYGDNIYHYDGNTCVLDAALNYYPDCIDMVSDNDGWVAGYYGNISHYDGSLWKNVTSPISSEIYCIKMTSSKTGWAVGSNGEILRYKE
jgi:hypothetical protein